MSGIEEEGASRFGQRTPPLTELIKSILERYPDGGQILKELIQNADDAGATEVNFLYDNRCHGIECLETQEFAKFQGPALYCHNNAIFMKDDWEGIQNLMRSNKKNDPLKVGRFGIGFNSVYHITDLPGIVSGTTVGFLDPHETHFTDDEWKRGISGKRYFFHENLPDHISRDQFLPFQGIFGCNLDPTESYNGTLFRFPLRTTPSRLSKKNYTKEMIHNLFESLREEASVILLFLKNVQSIKVHERKEDGEIECVFKVEVAEDTREEVRNKRQVFLNNAKESTITESRYVTSIQVTSASHAHEFRWLIVNQVGSSEERISELAAELCLLPWVGMAVALDDENNNASSGRIFCFLPLPSDVDCHTGLPVHVHGYFGLTDNRRGLVWPGAECQNTATAEWNELLVTKIAVEVYCKILEVLVQDVPSIGIGEEQRGQLVYSTLPALGKVQGHWKVLLEPLFLKLILESQMLFYAQRTPGNYWITLHEGMLDRLKESGITFETREAVLRILLNSSQVIITNVPPHVLEIVEKYFSPPHDINPALVRSVLKSYGVSTTRHEDKVLLLDFVLRDNPTNDLNGIALLPLANEQFINFSPHNHANRPSSSIFVPSKNCTAKLLPNMSHRFLNENLPRAVNQKLVAMAAKDVNSKNPTQLVRLTKEIVMQNLRSCLPSEWFNGNDKVQWISRCSDHPPESWLKDIWIWIHSFFPDTLSPFENVPIVDLSPMSTAATCKWLGVLSQHSTFIFGSDDSGNVLSTQVTSLLTAAGCTVLSDAPFYLRHPDINLYIAPSTPAGATLVLRRASLQAIKEHIKLSTLHVRGILREFFSRIPENLSKDQRNFLLQLPLFDNIRGSTTATQVNQQILNAASPEFNLPSGFNLRKSEHIISSADPKAYQLLTMLNVEILKPAAVFVRYLFPDIQAKSVYDHQETSTIMLWILHQMFNFKTQYEDFHKELRALPFVSTAEGEFKKPSELYDPNDPLLSNLFFEEVNKFPSVVYADGQVISTLKELGLQTKSMVTECELLEVAVSIACSPRSSSSIRKVQALVEILADNLAYLNQHVCGYTTLKTKLLQLNWLPCAKTPPNNIRFPASMPWFNSVTSFFAPAELRSKSHALLVGTSMPILDAKMDESLQDELGLTSVPPIHQVVSQLKTAVQIWQHQEQRRATSLFEEMLVAIYLHLSQKSKECVSTAINDASLKQWVWHGTGFCSPTQVALEKDFPLDLRPQLFLLPDDLNDRNSLADFFLQHGVRQKFSEEDIISVLAAVKEKHAGLSPKDTTSKEIERDLILCRSILEWVVKDGETLSERLQGKVFVPVQCTQNKLVLEPCKNCTYCDRDWLRHGGSELDIPDDYQLIHDAVPEGIARLLGVPALSTCLLSAETLGFEQTGPHEPITRRLNNILNEYKEGVGIFKELIQNADDARASKVRFLVDWRYGPTKSLLSPGMADCQGPALWAFNNAVFTDKDFENINKLAGATKADDLAKIGRFGLGFNAVYHLTDVPSFVSREHMVIFDPNVNHLESHIHDKSRPGIRINLASNPRPLSAFVDQFKPYHDVFGCKTQGMEGEKFHYDGTLFRFPFRTLREANRSEICQSVYDEAKVKEIVGTLRQNASLLLLYTQHVNAVELYEIGSEESPGDMKRLLSITKKETKSFETKKRVLNNLPFIEECSQWWKEKLTSSRNASEAGPSRSEHITIKVKGAVDKFVKTDTWLLTSCVGKEASVRLASGNGRKHGLLPCAGAAAKILRIPGNSTKSSTKLASGQVKGEAFCFLPLSIPTGFPVHVNGSFAVRSNRDGIWEKSTADHGLQIEAQWNESLLEDASSEAYVQLLQYMKSLSEAGRLDGYAENFHELWPCFETLQSRIWSILVKSVYTKIINNYLPLLWSNGKWLDIGSGYILYQDLRKVPGIVETLQSLGQNVFELPSTVIKSLERSGHHEVLQNRTLTVESFFSDLFFPNLPKIAQQLRDPIVCCGLDLILGGREKLVPLYKAHSCITCSADGLQLAKPCNLINPKAPVALLFSTEDCRFPIGEVFKTDNRLYILEVLGMVKDIISWDEICRRAKSVEELALLSYKRGLERSRNLIKYLKENIERIEKKEEVQNEQLEVLQSIKFIPLLRKPPTRYTLPWEGSKCYEKQFLSPKDLFLPSDVDLVGSCCFIVDDTDRSGCGSLGEKVKSLAGFDRRRPSNDQVLQQLDVAMKRNAKKTLIESVCKRIYEHFNAAVKERPDTVVDEFIEKLRGMPWLFIEGRFVSSENVAFNWKGSGAPYLYGLPDEYGRKYEKLLHAVGVKEVFASSDFIKALKLLSESKKDACLDKEEMKLTVQFVNELKVDVQKDTMKEHIGKIPLPDAKGVMCRSEELTINEAFWLKDRGDARYVHADITPSLAKALGARLLVDRRRMKYANTIGTPFGQHEKLTDRLKNILKSYPCDSGILKELVQNADDAEATEIHFVYDTRTLSCQRVIQDNAQQIQGPALCVYNDRHFSDEDLNGIQNLGIGSKSDDPEKTGQYGVGFNAVYHLTDCPSFLSNGDTLCILDPHCRYAPDATPEFPGELFKPVDAEFKEDFSDSVCGYLHGYFELKGCTMFRLPLRNRIQSHNSRISKTDGNMKILELLKSFKLEAKKSLLFLKHVKQISISKIHENGKLEREYQVSSIMDEEEDSKRHVISSLIKEYKNVPTGDVPWQGVTYPMILSDSKGMIEHWLIHQCFGVKRQTADDEIPDGQLYGLLPRGGVAALVSTSDIHYRSPRYSAYCFLPLPVYTSLPVHVNGHFALDSARRALWDDTDATKPLAKWNNFMKSHVLAPGYASLILEAKNYMPYCETEPENKTLHFFPDKDTADIGLHWYHKLFPNLSDSKDVWRTLAIAVYRFLGSTTAPILPLVVADDVTKDPKKAPRRIRHWLPVQESFFMDEIPETLWKVLLQIHLPVLVTSPMTIRNGFEEADITTNLVSPESVISALGNFPENSKCKIGDLPRKIEDTLIRSTRNLKKLIEYCQTSKHFASLLIGLPLLLTADGILRVFEVDKHVYCSIFSDLFPRWTHLFVHPDLVSYFSTVMYDKKKETSQVLLHLTTSALASFMADVFPHSMRGTTKHLDFLARGVFFEKWLMRLWLFLQYDAKPEQHETGAKPEHVLDALKEWPIIPTKRKQLVTIDNSKTVLDMTESGKESEGDKNIRECLKKLRCPSLDTDITFKKLNVPSHSFKYKSTVTNQPAKTDGMKAVTNPYVAHPHSVADVLQVLDYMKESDTLDVNQLSSDEIFEILKFFQDGYTKRLPKENYMYEKILKKLPFYKAINNSHYSLSSFSSYAIVPGGVPTQEIENLQIHTGCLFLHSDALPTLAPLLEGLGAGAKRSVAVFYAEYILPNFSIFSYDSQLKYLTHIRDNVLPRCHDEKEKIYFLDCLKSTACIPRPNGQLRRASEFYDPRNSLFRIMLEEHSDRFPPSPFNETGWLEFLTNIGLHSDANQADLLEFCGKVANVGNHSPLDETNRRRSNELVGYLLTHHHLHTSLLSTISTIKFIASEKVEANLLSLHKQHQCSDENQHPPFLQFSNSVPWKYRQLVWTSASLLPNWEELEKKVTCKHNCKKSFSKTLGIREPSVDTVVTHLQNISGPLAQNSSKEEALPQPRVLKNIMTSIYQFFQGVTACSGKDISDNCDDKCETIGNRLNTTQCILVADEKVLVRGDQLSFNVHPEWPLHPFLYAVPREYGSYEHILKRLGATEEITSLQLAKVFKTMKGRCGEAKMHPEYERKARDATFLFFKSVLKESGDGDGKSKISELVELYLPSEDKRLIKSNELLCKVPPRHTDTVAKLQHHALFSLEKCGLSREREDKYLQALPEHLRPKPFEKVVKEKLDPSCLRSPCQLRVNEYCEFIKKHITIMKSKEFQNGLERLFKHQKNSNELTEEEIEKSSRVGSAKVEIKCMETIKIHLVLEENLQPLENSSITRPCYVVKERDSWTFYIQHDNCGKSKQSLAINKILGWYLKEKHLLVVADMLSCESTEISDVLDSHDIQLDFAEEEYKLGHEVPVVFHYLMQQNPLFVFREGELVAVAVETRDDSEGNAVTDAVENEDEVFVKYVLAKIVRCVSSSSGRDNFDFEARYLIDLGNEEREVSVLDLYKFYQNDPGENPIKVMVPFTGITSGMPTNLDEAKREISEALRAAWRLPREMRRKVIKRLYLRWHPDKNPNNVEFATKMMAFLVSEVKRMEEEENRLSKNPVQFNFEREFRHYDNRARREQETYRNYRSCYGEPSRSFSATTNYTYPDPKEASRWLEQSENDLKAAQFLLTAIRPFNALVCFLCHQIVEKSLKAALYAKCGLTNNQLHTHDIYSLAQKVRNLEGWPSSNLLELTVVLGNYYLPTRYPNRQPSAIVPCNAFDVEQSTRAVQSAGEILRQVKLFTLYT